MYRWIIMQKKPAVSCQFFQMFPFHCNPEAMKDFDIHFFVYSMPFWGKLIVDKTLSIKENLTYNVDDHRHSHRHHKNTYAIHKSVLSSLLPYYTFLQTYIMCLMEILLFHIIL
jgi:hypothetical protein